VCLCDGRVFAAYPLCVVSSDDMSHGHVLLHDITTGCKHCSRTALLPLSLALQLICVLCPGVPLHRLVFHMLHLSRCCVVATLGGMCFAVRTI